MNQLEFVNRARAQNDPQLLVDAIPYSKAIGIEVMLQEEKLIGSMRFAQRLIGDLGIAALHGGTICTLLETTAMFSLLWKLENTSLPHTITHSVEFLRSGKPETTYASSVITRQGRRIANVRTHAWQNDRSKPIAASSTHFLLVPS